MISVLYCAIPIAFLLLVLGLLRKSRSNKPNEWEVDNPPPPSMGNGRWLHLSERIFDPSDARWLADELGFPMLASALQQGRKQLAIRWLKAMQASFDDLVKTPELPPREAPAPGSNGGWQMLWLTVRFKILISYALLVVEYFGPYHRLIPSFSWVPFSRGSERSFRQAALASSRSSR